MNHGHVGIIFFLESSKNEDTLDTDQNGDTQTAKPVLWLSFEVSEVLKTLFRPTVEGDAGVTPGHRESLPGPLILHRLSLRLMDVSLRNLSGNRGDG